MQPKQTKDLSDLEIANNIIVNLRLLMSTQNRIFEMEMEKLRRQLTPPTPKPEIKSEEPKKE